MALTIVFVVLSTVLAAVLVVLKVLGDEKQRQFEAENHQLKAEFAQVRAENDALAPYRQVVDARAEAQRLLGASQIEAKRVVDAAHLEARRILDAAQLRANAELQSAARARGEAEQEARRLVVQAEQMSAEELAKARADAARVREQANLALTNATSQVESMMRSANGEVKAIVDAANKQAEEIAGSAIEAVRNAARFEQVAKAMRNLIDGYGDQYVVPSSSLLDDLAAEYGFAEAGQELKNARERTRLMVKNNTAATCDYVEANRRETAIRFVVDAFNGKVDSILTRVKDSNVGPLEQEIRDAFNLVNYNGSAFRNARILDTYLQARLAELRWAATAQEIKLRDREEQRRIKERLKEEERAQREFERTMRESAKDEENLRKAMEKVQGQVGKATEVQRQRFEAQLAELTEKLRIAEEKSQRAKSMAEQTRCGHVYVISNVGSFGDDVFKIGLTRRLEPEDRVRELGDASVPFSFDIHALIFSEDAPSLERALHKHFLTAQVNKVNPRKEFFRVPIGTIREELDQLGITARWTLAAEAREYRETLAIERALKDNASRGRQWLEQQERLVETEPVLHDESAAAAG